MGFGAIAALAGTAISAGVSAAGSAGLFGGGGPNLGEYSSTLNKAANQYITPFAQNPAYWNIDIPGAATQSINFGLQEAPTVNQFNMGQLQALLGQALPGYQQTVGQMQGGLSSAFGLLPGMAAPIPSLLAGQVPTDVQQQIQRNAAFMGTVGGAGPSNIPTITARDLGLTSLDLEKTGQQQAAQYAATTTGLMGAGGNLLSLARNYLMPQPVNPMSLLPLGDIVAGTQWAKQANFDANMAAYNAAAASAAARVGAPPPNAAAGIAGAAGGLLNAFGQTNPQTGQTGWQTIGNLFGGGGGGGGGGGMIDLSGLAQGTVFGY